MRYINTRNMPENQDKMENARVGYQVATTMMITESEIFWSKFNTLLLANSIVVGAIVLSMTTEQPIIVLKILSIVLSSLGIVLCILLFSILKRSEGYFKNWTYSARQIEEEYLKDTFDILRRGADLSDGKTVYFRLGDERKPHQISCWGRFRIGKSSSWIIVCFISIYIILFLIGIYNLLIINT